MQIGMPGTKAPAAPSVHALRRRVTHLSLLFALELLLAAPSVWAGYLLGGKLYPQDAEQAKIWSLAATGVLAVGFIAAFILTLRARKAIRNTATIQQELTTRIDSVITAANAPKES